MRIALHPFPGGGLVAVPMPPFVAAIYCAQRNCAHQIPDFNAAIPFAIYVEVGGMDVEEATAYCMQRRGEIIDEARKLLLTPICLN